MIGTLSAVSDGGEVDRMNAERFTERHREHRQRADGVFDGRERGRHVRGLSHRNASDATAHQSRPPWRDKWDSFMCFVSLVLKR